jgi:hypothetical protein
MGNSWCKEIGEIRTSISDLQTTFANKQSPGASFPTCPSIDSSGIDDTLKELRGLIEKIPTTDVPLQEIRSYQSVLTEVASKLKTVPDSTPVLADVQSKLETLQTTLNDIPNHSSTLSEIASKLKTLPDSTPVLADVQSKLETLQTTLADVQSKLETLKTTRQQKEAPNVVDPPSRQNGIEEKKILMKMYRDDDPSEKLDTVFNLQTVGKGREDSTVQLFVQLDACNQGNWDSLGFKSGFETKCERRSQSRFYTTLHELVTQIAADVPACKTYFEDFYNPAGINDEDGNIRPPKPHPISTSDLSMSTDCVRMLAEKAQSCLQDSTGTFRFPNGTENTSINWNGTCQTLLDTIKPFYRDSQFIFRLSEASICETDECRTSTLGKLSPYRPTQCVTGLDSSDGGITLTGPCKETVEQIGSKYKDECDQRIEQRYGLKNVCTNFLGSI